MRSRTWIGAREPRRGDAPVLALALALALALGPTRATPATGAASEPGRTPEGWLMAEPGYQWSFPRDHWAHPGYRNEWWYFTGTLESVAPPGRRLGFQLTFFKIGLVPNPLPLDSAWATGTAVMAHAAVADLTGGRRVFSEVLWRAMPLLGGFGAEPDPLLAWALPPPGTPPERRWTLRLEDGAFRMSVDDAGRGVSFALVARPEKALVLEGPDGLSRKAEAPGYASLYYSLTRLATEGTVSLAGETWRVRGESWMDKEFGSSQLAPAQVGWDWFSLRLADGRDLMLYVLRRADGTADWRNGTLVGADGAVRYLGPEAWSVAARGTWKSPETGATYPSGWDVAVPSEGIRVRVEPEQAAQENRSSLAVGLFYWEGAVRVVDADGRRAGEGYVELTGYGERNRPPI